MTNATPNLKKFVAGTARNPRTSLMLDRLMDEERRREIGQRITDLRERSPHTQPVMAQKLGITLRAYQKLEEKGTTKHERCVEVAGIHKEWTERTQDWAHADANWIWDGREQQATPDPFEMPKLDQILDQLAAMLTELETAQVARDDLQRRLGVIEDLLRRDASGG